MGEGLPNYERLDQSSILEDGENPSNPVVDADSPSFTKGNAPQAH